MRHAWLLIAIFVLAASVGCQSSSKKPGESSEPSSASSQSDYTKVLLTNTRQFTFSGRRSGEGYFGPEGKLMVFQSEREADNPFYQIYLKNLETGDTTRVSPGYGKTTGAWVHPSKTRVLYASTHLDPEAKAKQEQKLEQRRSGKRSRYSWDYDENYDLFEASSTGKILKRLTKEKGYDAEGSYSPDGKYVAFSSNRHAYEPGVDEAMAKRMKLDPSYGLEIYIMNADGSGVKRLTNTDGYDGGPFFSPDGKRITWRRFAKDGHTAEVYTMNIDGSDKKQITKMKAMSWAPFYHPSGDYLIYTTNIHGYSNFELYIVDAEGQKPPVRVTDLVGFDGLPVFLPNGRQMAWSRKNGQGVSQIFIGDWNDKLARKALGLSAPAPRFEQMQPEIRVSDTKDMVEYFASAKMKGRMTGSAEEAAYQKTLIELAKGMGLQPVLGKDKWTHEFEFVSSVEAPEGQNRFVAGSEGLKLSTEWTPVMLSKAGAFQGEDMVFVGYGLETPADGGLEAYSSYTGKEAIAGQWVVMLRDIPSDVSEQQRAAFFTYSRPDHKVRLAEQQQAAGVIFITGPRTDLKSELMSLSYDRASGKSSIPVVSMSRQVFMSMLADSDFDLNALQAKLDKGESVEMKRLQTKPFSLNIELKTQKRSGRSFLALLKTPGAKSTVVIGAHGDHLGDQEAAGSLKSAETEDTIHYGADDNASGMAAVMEVAHALSSKVQNKKIKLRQNVMFAIWSGEELGNLGSSAFLKSKKAKNMKMSAYLNLDMVGRMQKTVSLQGLGSSKDWQRYIEQMAIKNSLAIQTTQDPYLPTDAISFYLNEVPVLSFFTGAHEDYHTPLDTADKLNYEGLVSIASYANGLIETLSSRSRGPVYQKVERKSNKGMGRGFRIFLGTIPDYSQEGVTGVRLQGVVKGGPAEQAGLKSGDIIVKFSSHDVKSLYDYVYTLQVVKPGEKTTITVLRDGKSVDLPITPSLKK
ncbi:MAG: M28 family peptidase [Bdellovibrionales bacterium]|nr:M28 family peptidase [Bdellovibrionales bacterium]